MTANDTTRAYRVAHLAEVTTNRNSLLPNSLLPADDTDLRIAEVYARTGHKKSAVALIERRIQATDDESLRKKYENRLQVIQAKPAE